MQIFHTRVRNVINACYIFPKNCYVRMAHSIQKQRNTLLGTPLLIYGLKQLHIRVVVLWQSRDFGADEIGFRECLLLIF